VTAPTAIRRDHGIDALRAIAVVGVVTGHWLVTCLVIRPDGALAAVSPLAGMPWLAPATWLLQTLGLFFFVAGWARASRDSTARPRGRWGRAVGVLLAAWAVALAVAAVAGVPGGSLRTVAKLVVSPLWFLVVLLVLGALAAPVRRLVAHRSGPALAVAAGVAVVAAADAGLGWAPVTTVAAWLVPYALGMAAAAGRLRRPPVAAALLVGGVAALLGFLLLAGYPATAVGVPGAQRSNLAPPSLAAVSLAVAQVGAALLLRRWLDRPRPAVTRLNGACLGVYLWHQSALLVVTVLTARLAGPVTGLHTAPDGPAWIGARLLWLPVFAAATLALIKGSGASWRIGDAGRVYSVSRFRPHPDPRRERADDHMEVIAVRDSDPPSRGRAARQLD
jgi:peptidoglycan/LPS O-acetylase OafA/YrhL